MFEYLSILLCLSNLFNCFRGERPGFDLKQEQRLVSLELRPEHVWGSASLLSKANSEHSAGGTTSRTVKLTNYIFYVEVWNECNLHVNSIHAFMVSCMGWVVLS
jgi:hypothetical protein